MINERDYIRNEEINTVKVAAILRNSLAKFDLLRELNDDNMHTKSMHSVNPKQCKNLNFFLLKKDEISAKS